MELHSDRRPIAARRLAIIQRTADLLVERGAKADAISAAGMVAGLLAGLCLAATAWAPGFAQPLWLLAALLVQLRLLANLLDGMVAIGSGTASKLGELWNEVPDRVSDSAALLGLGVAAGSLALGACAALAAMATAYVRAVGKAAGAPSDFRGPMAKQQRMFVVTLVAAWCGVAPVWSGGVAAGALWLILALSIVTALRRLRGIAAGLRAP